MAAVSVTFDGTRINDAEATTTWVGASQEIEFRYQGTYSCSVQVKTTEAGTYYYNSTSSWNMTSPNKVWLAKGWVTNYGALDGNGMILEIGTGSRSTYYRYFVYTASTYPILGGWCLLPIDPNISGYRSATTGSPTLSSTNFFGIRADFSLTSRGQNVALDAIDYISTGTGLTLVGGDGGDADGTFTSFITYDEGTLTNRYGICTTKEGIIYILGVLTIGTATATVFTDSNQTIVFPNGRFGTGFCGIDINLASATTVVSFSAITMNGRGEYGYDGGTNDTRPDFEVTNTSGSATFEACTWNNFRAITFTSVCDTTDSTFYAVLGITQASSTFDNCTFDSSPVATNTACLTSNDPSLITNSTFVSGGTGHAIELTTACAGNSYDFDANIFSGYSGTPGSNLTSSSGSSEAAIFNNSQGAVTFNILNSGTVPSVRNGASATTTITSNVTYTITIQDEGANAIVGAQVAMFKTSDDSVLHASSATNASGQVTGSVASGTGAVYIRVRQSTNLATFSTAQAFTSEELNTDTNHSFVSGEAVVYDKNGGTASIGLTDGTTYYVNAVDANTVTLHLTAAAAIAGTGDIDLTTNGSETHHLDPVRYYPTSTVGTIGSTAFTVTITMIQDTTATG